MSEQFRFDDPRQADLYERLRQIGDWPAAAFRDTCKFFAPHAEEKEFEEFETAAHLAVHLQREIKSAVAAVLVPLDFERPEDGGDIATRDAILRVFDLPPDHEIATLWEKMGKLHERAHRRALAAPTKLDHVRDAWEIFQRLLALLLAQLDAAWPVVYLRIKEILAVPQPGKDHISLLRNRIPNNVSTFRYFFEGAKGKAWVEALTRKNKLFTDPPETGGWPAIEYLRGIAPEYPEQAHNIVKQLPSTPNVFTHMAIIQIANALPSHLAKDLVLTEATAFADGIIGDEYLGREIAKAAERIAPDETDAALRAFEKLLALRKAEGDGLRDFVSTMDLYAYTEAITAVGSLSAHAPQQTYEMLANLLDTSLRIKHPESTNDDSNGWMPAIEPHDQNHAYEPLPHLAGAVRDATEAVCTAAPASVTAVVTAAEQRGWTFFRRLALHLLRRFAPGSAEARERALNPSILQDWQLKHEARLLLREVYPRLSDIERQQVIDVILAGPTEQGTFESDDQREQYREWWITQRLWWVREWLHDYAKARYDDLVARHKEPDETSDFIAWVGTMWVGPTSPKSAAELTDMDVPSIIEFLKNWQPATSGERFSAPSREGIARELQTVATSRAVEFSQAARTFKALDPTYVRGILGGLQSAVQNRQVPLDWAAIVDLCLWAAAQEREIAGRTDDGWNDDDPHWGWTRSAIVRVFEAGFRDGPGQIPIALRTSLWPVLSRTLDDPDPTPERDDHQTSDPLTTAINSTRGQALRAIILYALWARNSTPEEQRTKDFSDMPEVRETLMRVVTSEPSAAVRAIFGELLHILYFLDSSWIAEHLDDLFPSGPLGDAAFQTYVIHGRPRLPIDKLLMPQFNRAIDSLSNDKKFPPYYTTHFARHILWLYAAGETTLDAQSLADRFFRAADGETRAYAVGFAPTAVRDVFENDDEAFRTKLEEFWSWCTQREGVAAALRGFGMWTSEEKLELSWRLAELERALNLAGSVVREFEVIDDLADASRTHAAAALRCTRLLFNGTDQMRRYTWVHDGHIRRILAGAVEHGDPATAAGARAFASHLVGLGFHDLLDLAGTPTTA